MNKNNKKQKRSINVFDVVVILLIVLLLATLIYRVYSGAQKDTLQSGTKYVMYFECDGAYDSLVNYLENGEAVYLQNGALLGNLYAEDEEKGAVYELVDDIPTFAEDVDDPSTDEVETLGSKNNVIFVEGANENVNISYRVVKIGGSLRLSYDAIRVQKGNYFTIDGVNVTEGSVITVYTDDTEFTLTVKDIVIAE